jgi:hypothetical protein
MKIKIRRNISPNLLIGGDYMNFILQKDKDISLDVEIYNLQKILDKQKYLYDYIYLTLEEMNNLSIEYKNYVQVGTLEFVGLFLKKFYNINNLNPIFFVNYKFRHLN